MCGRGMQLHLSHVLGLEVATGLCLKEVSCLFCSCSFIVAPSFLGKCWMLNQTDIWSVEHSAVIADCENKACADIFPAFGIYQLMDFWPGLVLWLLLSVATDVFSVNLSYPFQEPLKVLASTVPVTPDVTI